MLMTASAIPPNRISGRASAQLDGRRKRVAVLSSTRTSVSTAIAIAAITLAMISEEAWWLRYLTSGVRGLTAGLAMPFSAGVSPWMTPTVGALLATELVMMPLSR